MRKRPLVRFHLLVWLVVLAATGALACFAEERHERFDRNPRWQGHNNRARVPRPRRLRQDFGCSKTRYAGGELAGEIGGFFTPAAEPAYYAKPIERKTLNDRLEAAGKLEVFVIV